MGNRNELTHLASLARFRITVAAIMLTPMLAIPALAADEGKPVQASMQLPQADIPQPQFFCGYCHIVTYPGAVQKGYELWKKGKHNDTGCVECHYPLSENAGKDQEESESVTHIPKKPPERFSYLQLGGETVRTRPRIPDENCMTTACHGKPEDKFKTKKIQFTEKVHFTHEPHLEEKNQIKGQKINCTSCHQHETEKKKFEVTQASCFACHFNGVKFNEGRAKCDLCHELPEKPIQTSGDEPITHQMLQKAKVQCASCHIESIRASGGTGYEAYFEGGELKTALVLGTQAVKKENCLACHDREEHLKEDGNEELMHQKHVTVKNARCLDCHRPVQHTKSGQELTDVKKAVRDTCTTCHLEPHLYQRLLVVGEKREGVLASPDPMFKARTNCIGCHMEKKTIEKGQVVLAASEKTCVRCHTKDHKKMLKDWNTELEREIKDAKEIEAEVLDIIKSIPEAPRKVKAREMLAKARENLKIMEFGNGVHNKKYSMMLIDAAVTSYDEVIEYLEEDQ